MEYRYDLSSYYSDWQYCYQLLPLPEAVEGVTTIRITIRDLYEPNDYPFVAISDIK